MARPFKPCSVDGCNRSAAEPGSGRGYCAKHYLRLRRHGDPLFSKLDRENKDPICKIDGCDRPKASRGLCGTHATRLKRYGDPLAHHPRYRSIERWMQENATYSGVDCLKWPFPVGDQGRGTATVEGVLMSAPRAMCRLAHGEPPTPRHEAAHSCGKGHEGCMNPKHLSWKTASENRMDMVEHGTLPRGEDVNTAKLTQDQVRKIRKIGSEMHRKDVAAMFEVSYSTVWEIQTRRSWAWLD